MLKWCLNRPHQAKNFDSLLCFVDLNKTSEVYKPLREFEIKKSEHIVSSIINVLETEYLKPFSPLLDENKLYNISSGVSKEEGVDELLAVYEVGKSMANEFKTNGILSDQKAFHNPIPRKKVPAFQSVKVKI